MAGESREGAAAWHAGLILEVLRLAAAAAERDQCLGARLELRFSVRSRREGAAAEGMRLLQHNSSAGMRGWWRWARITQMSVAHIRSGHDLGCEAIGVSLAELERFLAIHDECDVTEFLLEGVRVCVSELADSGGVPHGCGLFELLSHEVCSRLTW